MVFAHVLTLLDTDPDPLPDSTDDGEDDLDVRAGCVRLEHSDSDEYENRSDDHPGTHFGFSKSSRFSSQASSLHVDGLRRERASQGIKHSSIGTYGRLFDWTFQRYSFPSGQLRIKGVAQKAKRGNTEDQGARDEVERLKRELRAELGGEKLEPTRNRPSPTDTHVVEGNAKSEAVIHTDLLGEFTEGPPCLLDLEDEMEQGYSWRGPVRDLETGQPLTPYEDDPTSSSSSSSRGGNRQTARRSRPFTPRGRGRGRGHGTGTPNGILAENMSHKSSTQSLPSSSRGRGRQSGPMGRVNHQPSLPVFPQRHDKSQGRHRRLKNIDSPYARLLSKPQARRHVPENLLKSSSLLQRSMMLSWKQSCADKSYQQAVLSLLDWLSNTINMLFDQNYRGGPGRFEVDVFGSVSWGGETGTSGDLDMVVIDHEQRQGYMPDLWRVPPGETPLGKSRSQRSYRPPNTLPGVYDLYRLSGLLRNMGMHGVTTIRGANTPIVKFKVANFDSQTKDLECDINVNDLGGWHNSSLILAYCELSPYVLRPLIHALKLWSSSQDLNDPSGAKGPATMSSYCLTLMAIAYLQVRGHLPNLQADINVPSPSYPTDRNDPDLIWVGWGKSQGVHAHVAYSRTPSKEWRSTDPDLTAGQALRGFFAYFGSRGEVIGNGPMMRGGRSQIVRQYDRTTQVVSILNGGVTERAESLDDPTLLSKEQRLEQEVFMGKGDRGIQPANWRDKNLVVQDPFIWQKNCTTSMHVKGLEKWFEAVDRTDNTLRTKGEDATLADILVPPPPDLTPPVGKGPKAKRGPKATGDPVERFAQRVQGSRGRGRPRGGAPSVNGSSKERPRAAVGQLLDV